MAAYLRRERRIDFLWIFIGTLLMAVSTNLFYAPAGMVPGGFTGLAMIIRRLTEQFLGWGLPLWLANILLNVPLILFSIKLRGWRFLRRTFFASLLFSFHLLYIPEYALVKDDLVLITVFGGVCMGLGLGFVFLGKATTGGTDTLAALIQHFIPHTSVATILPFLDGCVIALSAFIFGINITCYAIISVTMVGMIADYVVSGTKNAKMAYIISDEYQNISAAVLKEMDRGVTMLEGTGMYTNTHKPVLLVAVSKKEIVTLRSIVADYDKTAFMILTDATEVRGEGFLNYTNMHDEL